MPETQRPKFENRNSKIEKLGRLRGFSPRHLSYKTLNAPPEHCKPKLKIPG